MKESSNCIIISGFPGVGKSHAATVRKDVLDLDSSQFKGYRWEYIWEEMYVTAIKKAYESEDHRVILISSHSKVRELLHEKGIPFICVVPNKSLRNEYMIRYLRRGSSVAFMRNIRVNWNDWIDRMHNTELCIELQSGEHISDVLPLQRWA